MTPELKEKKKKRKAKEQSLIAKEKNSLLKKKSEKPAYVKTESDVKPDLKYRPMVLADDDEALIYLKGKILDGFEFISAQFVHPKNPRMPKPVLQITLRNKKTKRKRNYEYNYRKMLATARLEARDG